MFTDCEVFEHRDGLLGVVHEKVVEQLQHHRVGRPAVARTARRASPVRRRT